MNGQTVLDGQHDGSFQTEHVLVWDRRDDRPTTTGFEFEA